MQISSGEGKINRLEVQVVDDFGSLLFMPQVPSGQVGFPTFQLFHDTIKPTKRKLLEAIKPGYGLNQFYCHIQYNDNICQEFNISDPMGVDISVCSFRSS